MASFLTALANIGSQYAEGRTAGLEEREKLAQEKVRTGIEQTQQELARQRLEFEKQQFKAQPDIQWVGVDQNRKLPWSISKGKFIDPKEIPGYTQNTITGPLTSGASMLSMIDDPDIRNKTMARMSSLFESLGANATPAQVEAIVKDGAAYSEKLVAEKQKAADKQRKVSGAVSKLNPVVAAEAGLPPNADDYPGGAADPQFQLDSQQWGQKAEKILARLAGSASQARAEATQGVKTQFMNTQERAQWEQLATLEPMAEKLGKFIEDNKLENENSLLTLLGQYGRYGGYRAGMQQDPIHQELIKDAAAIQVMGAAPWVRLGRGKYTLELIEPHLPKPTDTPANMYDKVIWLRENVIADAKDALKGLTPPGGQAAAGGGPAAGPSIPAPVAPAQTDVSQRAAPQGAMFTGRGTDGKLHYLDKNHQDLGLVPGQP